MKKEILDRIEIPATLNNYIESLNYEVDARKSLLTFALNKGMDNTDAFNKYHDEYREFFMKFEVAKKDLYDRYVKEKWDDQKVTWKLYYSTNTIEITKEI